MVINCSVKIVKYATNYTFATYYLYPHLVCIICVSMRPTFELITRYKMILHIAVNDEAPGDYPSELEGLGLA